MRRSRVMLVVAAASAIAAACSTFSASDTPATPDAGDATPDGIDPPPPPPPPPLADAASDATGPSCEGGANIVCENFDQVGAIADVAGVTFGAGGTFDIVASPVVSPPHAGVAAFAPDAGFSATAEIVRDLPATGIVTTVTCDFELNILTADPTASPDLFEVDLKPVGTSSLLYENVILYFNQNGVGLHLYVTSQDDDGGFPGIDQDVGSLVKGQWWHVHVAIGGGHIAVTASPAGGGTPANAMVSVKTLDQVSSLTMKMGLFLSPPSPVGPRIALDDIRCALTP